MKTNYTKTLAEVVRDLKDGPGFEVLVLVELRLIRRALEHTTHVPDDFDTLVK